MEQILERIKENIVTTVFYNQILRVTTCTDGKNTNRNQLRREECEIRAEGWAASSAALAVRGEVVQAELLESWAR